MKVFSFKPANIINSSTCSSDLPANHQLRSFRKTRAFVGADEPHRRLLAAAAVIRRLSPLFSTISKPSF